MLLQFLRPSFTHANILWAMREPSIQPPIEICTQKFLTLGIAFMLGKTLKYTTDAALHEHNVALLELQVLDVQAYATQEKMRAMSKYYTNPYVTSKSTFGLIINENKLDPIPGTISADYLQTMQEQYPALVTLSNNHSTPLKKADIAFYTTLAFHERILQKSSHSDSMKTYLNNRLHESNSYLSHAKRYFPLEETITSLTIFRIGASYPLSKLASKGSIPYRYRVNCYFWLQEQNRIP
jgi:hypothetical protein